jgi:hypothetical protein
MEVYPLAAYFTGFCGASNGISGEEVSNADDSEAAGEASVRKGTSRRVPNRQFQPGSLLESRL